MKPSEFMDAAADEVSKGWCQGTFGAWREDEGDVCALGAFNRLWRVAPPAEVDSISWPGLQHALANSVGDVSIPRWNDEPDRTAGEVADAMRTCAKSLRERGE